MSKSRSNHSRATTAHSSKPKAPSARGNMHRRQLPTFRLASVPTSIIAGVVFALLLLIGVATAPRNVEPSEAPPRSAVSVVRAVTMTSDASTFQRRCINHTRRFQHPGMGFGPRMWVYPNGARKTRRERRDSPIHPPTEVNLCTSPRLAAPVCNTHWGRGAVDRCSAKSLSLTVWRLVDRLRAAQGVRCPPPCSSATAVSGIAATSKSANGACSRLRCCVSPSLGFARCSTTGYCHTPWREAGI